MHKQNGAVDLGFVIKNPCFETPPSSSSTSYVFDVRCYFIFILQKFKDYRLVLNSNKKKEYFIQLLCLVFFLYLSPHLECQSLRIRLVDFIIGQMSNFCNIQLATDVRFARIEYIVVFCTAGARQCVYSIPGFHTFIRNGRVVI